MTPFPYLHRAYSHVPPQPEKKAAAIYRTAFGGGSVCANRSAATATPRHAETVCTTISMAGEYNG